MSTSPPDLLLTGVVMPGMPGADLSARVRGLVPGLRVRFMSGYTDDVMDRWALDGTGDGVLQKPFDGRRLVAAVEQALS